jgi:hypothetical protein
MEASGPAGREAAARIFTAGAALYLAFFMLPTQIHERYVFPVVPLLCLVAFGHPVLALALGVLSVTHVANLVHVVPWDQRVVTLLNDLGLTSQRIAAANVVALALVAYVLLEPFGRRLWAGAIFICANYILVPGVRSGAGPDGTSVGAPFMGALGRGGHPRGVPLRGGGRATAGPIARFRHLAGTGAAIFHPRATPARPGAGPGAAQDLSGPPHAGEILRCAQDDSGAAQDDRGAAQGRTGAGQGGRGAAQGGTRAARGGTGAAQGGTGAARDDRGAARDDTSGAWDDRGAVQGDTSGPQDDRGAAQDDRTLLPGRSDRATVAAPQPGQAASPLGRWGESAVAPGVWADGAMAAAGAAGATIALYAVALNAWPLAARFPMLPGDALVVFPPLFAALWAIRRGVRARSGPSVRRADTARARAAAQLAR